MKFYLVAILIFSIILSSGTASPAPITLKDSSSMSQEDNSSSLEDSSETSTTPWIIPGGDECSKVPPYVKKCHPNPECHTKHNLTRCEGGFCVCIRE